MPHAAFEGAAFGASGGRSSVGRAPALQAGGRRFDSDRLHQFRQAFPAGAQQTLEGSGIRWRMGFRNSDRRGDRPPVRFTDIVNQVVKLAAPVLSARIFSRRNSGEMPD